MRISDGSSDVCSSALGRIVKSTVVPALERQIAAMQAQRPQATMDAGLWAPPGGDEWYAWGLRASTTTRMTPEEVHRMGLAELAQLPGRMDPILRNLAYPHVPVGARMTAVAHAPRYTFPGGDKRPAATPASIHLHKTPAQRT